MYYLLYCLNRYIFNFYRVPFSVISVCIGHVGQDGRTPCLFQCIKTRSILGVGEGHDLSLEIRERPTRVCLVSETRLVAVTGVAVEVCTSENCAMWVSLSR